MLEQLVAAMLVVLLDPGDAKRLGEDGERFMVFGSGRGGVMSLAVSVLRKAVVSTTR